MNVGEALERVLGRKRTLLKEAAAVVNRSTTPPPLRAGFDNSSVTTSLTAPIRPATRKDAEKEIHRAGRRERYEAVVALHQQGFGVSQIAREVGIGRKTVRRFLHAGSFPERAPSPRRPSLLDPYEPYLRERWEAGCHIALQLWREIQAQGFPGASYLVRRFVARWRSTPGRRGPPPRSRRVGTTPSPIPLAPFRVPSPRQTRWILLRAPEDLPSDERTYRAILLDRDHEIAEARTLAMDFARLITDRDGAALAPWLKRATASIFPEFRAFVKVLDHDRAAVEAALHYEWSNGQTEGQITRLKLAKRQMYGRGSLALLKARLPDDLHQK